MDKKDVKNLYKAIVSLDNVAECELFFEDLCTPGELEAMAERWRVCQLIEKGQHYREINKSTGVSTATITRVARSYNHGTGGYRLVLEKTKKKFS